ncbi:hypothetical protein [Enterococcus sp. CSURQ0835]|uniref:hypothetical protein n=1 Tax=Enterococcus sp. CSURQ0835 TaxID=2681394 RepID=UPI001356AD40|nr:hypothetical protein [Enterococcus sp. CSURQ0835]
MDQVMACFNFLGDWLLYTFPLYQGMMEVSEQEAQLEKFAANARQTKSVPDLYWFIPPLKIYLERKRTKKILFESTVDDADLKKLFTILNKATAWLYVSFAGLLNGIASTHELAESFHFHWSLPIFLLVIIGLLILSNSHVLYRVSAQREKKMMKKLHASKKEF